MLLRVKRTQHSKWPSLLKYNYKKVWAFKILRVPYLTIQIYCARRLMESRVIESAAYCSQILLAQLYKNGAQNTSVNWVIRLLLSLLCRSKMIPLSGGHCSIIFICSFWWRHLFLWRHWKVFTFRQFEKESETILSYYFFLNWLLFNIFKVRGRP